MFAYMQFSRSFSFRLSAAPAAFSLITRPKHAFWPCLKLSATFFDSMAGNHVLTTAVFQQLVQRSNNHCDAKSAAISAGRKSKMNNLEAAAAAKQISLADAHSDYAAAISDLNSLQSNAKTIEISRNLPPSTGYDRQRDTLEMLKVLNISMDEIDALNVIHVTGTKGKGSTCAYTEAMLRARGYKTGLFTSPHLIEARERIRVNGKPISQAEFARHFRTVFDALHGAYDTGHARFVQMPAYFQFLTVMAFHVFVHAQIDVAVIEVGIGGEYDSTNIIRDPVVCAVSTIGYDHMPLLGNRLSQIAWNKAGIFKPSAVAVTASNQTDEALEVLTNRAAERNCKLFVVPEFKNYSAEVEKNHVPVRLQSSTQHTNVSLALQSVKLWCDWRRNDEKHDAALIRKVENEKKVEQLDAFPIGIALTKALNETQWAGRFQRLIYRNLSCYIDGAHTMESIKSCASWYMNAVNEIVGKPYTSPSSLRALIFNSTSDREIETLLLPLVGKFDYVFFVPNQAVSVTANHTDNVSVLSPYAVQLARCHDHERQWRRLQLISAETQRKGVVHVNGSVSDAFDKILQISNENDLYGENVHVLVTGSLHLVGAFLSLADPTLSALLDENDSMQ